MIKKDDRDRYLTTLFIPSNIRPHIVALYAFNQEVAKTQESVSEPMIGEIRLQWWREAIDQILAGHVREHPVVESLADISEFDQLAPLFHEIIDARQSDLYQQSTWSIDDLKHYANSVGGALNEAALTIAVDPNNDQKRIARQVGAAWSLLGIIRALPFHENVDGIYSSFADDNSVAIDFDSLRPSIEKITDFIEENIIKDKSTIQKIGKSFRSLLLLNSATIHYMHKLKRQSLNPFELANQRSSDASLIMQLIWTSVRGRF